MFDCVTGQGTARAGLRFGLLVCPRRLGALQSGGAGRQSAHVLREATSASGQNLKRSRLQAVSAVTSGFAHRPL